MAALLVLLGEESASILLKSLDDNERELVSSEMVNLPLMTVEQQTSVLKEFTEMAIQANSGVSGSVEYTRMVLEKSVGVKLDVRPHLCSLCLTPGALRTSST
jgi:flagellar motor switch protein FliG